MVQTTVRNIFLGIVRNQNPICQEFITSYPFVKYFVYLVCFARDNWFRIDNKLIEAMYGPLNLDRRTTQKVCAT